MHPLVIVSFRPILLLISELTDQRFWADLYTAGQIGSLGASNILVKCVVRLLVIGLILLAANICIRVMVRLVRRGMSALDKSTEHGMRRLNTLNGLLVSTLTYCVDFVAILLILFTLGVSWKGLAPLLGAASVLGLAIGFGAQKLVRDVITGLFILGEGQFDAGDWVTIGAVTGRVEEIGLRVTRMRDEQGRLYVIANGDITQVFNASRGHVRLTVDVTLQRLPAFDDALATVQQIMLETLRSFDVTPATGEEPAVLVVGMEASKVTVRLVLWVPTLKRELVEDALRRRVLAVQQAEALALA